MDAHLAPLLFVSSKEFANLIHQTGVLLFPPEPESALPWGARCSHASCCCCWWRWPLCLLSSPLPSYSKAHSAKTRLCCSFRVVCSPSDAQGLSLKVSSPWPKGTMGHTESQVGEGGGVCIGDVHGSGSAPGILWSFSGCVSHCRPPHGPGHCSSPHLPHPGRRDNKGYLWVWTHTLMQSSPKHCGAIVASAPYIFFMHCVWIGCTVTRLRKGKTMVWKRQKPVNTGQLSVCTVIK